VTSDGRRDWNEDAAVIVSGLVIRQPCVVAVLAGRGRHRAGRQQPGSVVPGRLPATRRDAPVKSERQMCVRARPTRRTGKKKKTRHMNQSVILIVFAMFLSPSSGQLAGTDRPPSGQQRLAVVTIARVEIDGGEGTGSGGHWIGNLGRSACGGLD